MYLKYIPRVFWTPCTLHPENWYLFLQNIKAYGLHIFETFLSIIFILVSYEISISDDVHQTCVNSGIGTTYRSGALEFTSLFSVVCFTQCFIACDKIFSTKTDISSLTLWLSNYPFICLPQSHNLLHSSDVSFERFFPLSCMNVVEKVLTQCQTTVNQTINKLNQGHHPTF